MKDVEGILDYYKNELKWNPPFAEILSKYSPVCNCNYCQRCKCIVQNGCPGN
ncbi:hypothetical protein ACFHWD_10730 [Clostridium sp. MT-14]|nr:hypothetical protein [Clostridium aromativorans]